MTSDGNSDYLFMDLEGRSLSFDPREQIKLANQSTGTFDYRAFHSKTNTGIVELWGLRDHQEDRVIVSQFNQFVKFSKEEWIYVLKSTIKKLQAEITEKKISGGSTLCVTIISDNQIYTASVGDSNAFLALLDQHGKVTIFFRLNRILHHPTEEHEAKRLNHNVVHGRLGGVLAISRALGDNYFEKLGLLHEPNEIYVDEINIPENGQGFVINACDGLIEGNCLTNQDMINIIEENQSQSPDILALKLATAAFRNGSQDNISVLVTSIKPSLKEKKYLAVFDGHGGDKVSEYISQHFDATLNKVVLEIHHGKI